MEGAGKPGELGLETMGEEVEGVSAHSSFEELCCKRKNGDSSWRETWGQGLKELMACLGGDGNDL